MISLMEAQAIVLSSHLIFLQQHLKSMTMKLTATPIPEAKK